jgi:RHS repeat-associated protein
VSATKGAVSSSQSFTYDNLGRRLSVTSSIQNPGSSIRTVSTRTYGYDAAGQRISQAVQYSSTPPLQHSISYSYDQYGQLTNAYKTKNGTPQKDYRYAYSYDKIGNRLAETRNAFSLSFSHNTLNQMTSRNWTGGLTVQGRATPGADVQSVDVNAQQAALDSDGTYLVESTPVNPGAHNVITAVNKDKPLPPQGSPATANTKSIKWEKVAVEPRQIAFGYDPCGNMTSDGVRSYSWDADNRLISVSDLSHKSDYQYDGLNRKVRTTEYVKQSGIWNPVSSIQYVYDGWNCVAELAVTPGPTFTLTKSYTWGIDLSGTLSGAGGVGGLLSATTHCSPLTTYWFAYDGNGDVVNLIDMSSGAISAHYEYDPFGRLVCKEGSYADGNEYRFSTKRYCAMWSLYDYGYRHYSPDLGRWISRDPHGITQFANLYDYTANAPLLKTDYLGLQVTIPGANGEMGRVMAGFIADVIHLDDKCTPNDVEYKGESLVLGYPFEPVDREKAFAAAEALETLDTADLGATTALEGAKKGGVAAINSIASGSYRVTILKTYIYMVTGKSSSCFSLFTRIRTRYCTDRYVIFPTWRYDWSDWSEPSEWRGSKKGIGGDNIYSTKSEAENDVSSCLNDQIEEEKAAAEQRIQQILNEE